MADVILSSNANAIRLSNLRIFLHKVESAIQTNRDSGQTWVDRRDLQLLREFEKQLTAPETNSCAKFRIGDDVVVTRWHAPAKVKGFIYELEDPFQYPERERDLSPPAQKANSCVCGEPNSPGTHRTDGPCLAPIGDHHP